MSLGQYLFQLAVLVRLPQSFSLVAAVVSAAIIGTHGGEVLISQKFALLLAALLCVFYAGMVMNDSFDFRDDRIFAPWRPIASGAILYGFAWSLACYLLFLGTLMFSFYSRQTMILGLLLCLLVVIYNFSPREGVLGCLLYGACWSLAWTLVLAGFGKAEAFSHFAVLYGCVEATFCLLQRIAKRKAPVQYLILAVILLLVGVVFFVWKCIFNQSPVFWGLLLVPILAAAYLWQLWRLWQGKSRRPIRIAAEYTLRGGVLVNAVLLFSVGYWWQALCILGFIVPCHWSLTFFKRRQLLM